MPQSSPETLADFARNKQLLRNKQPWKALWDLTGEYIHTRKQDFNNDIMPGEFLNRNLFDSTGPKAAKIAASSFRAMMWPDSGQKIKMRPPRSLDETLEIKKYYEFVTDSMSDTMDAPTSGLRTSLDEYFLDDQVTGTAGLEPFLTDENEIQYRPWGVQHMSIDEGKNGIVNTVHLNISYTVARLVDEYGLDKVSEKVREKHKKGRFDELIPILIAIKPLQKINGGPKSGNAAMKFQSRHYEVTTKHLLKRGGFEDMPIKVGRATKLIGEIYGRSSGMDALPDVLESNAIWEAVTIAIEKLLDPPLGVIDAGVLGGEEIDTSAGAINVFNVDGRAGEKNPIFPLFTVGEIKQVVQLLEALKQSINDHFSLDRLLDFNNKAEMTLGEAQIRDRLRNDTLQSPISRKIVEVFNPFIEQTFNMKLARGDFGVLEGSEEQEQAFFLGEDPIVIPDAVAKLMLEGKDVYRIQYVTPAQRILESEEATGILRMLEASNLAADNFPESLDTVDMDEGLMRLREVVGAPSQMSRAKAAVATIRVARAEALEQQQEQEQIQAASEAARNVGQLGSTPGKAAA